MINGNKLLMSIFAIMMAMCFCVGCSSSQEKPSEDVMKNEILKTLPWANRADVKYSIDKFKITNGFFSKEKGSGGESTPYCIEVNFKLSMTSNIDVKDEQVINNRKYHFTKRGGKWYGGQGWR